MSSKSKYVVRNPDGLVLGPIRFSTVIDLIRDLRVTGSDFVKVDNAPWKPAADVPELADHIRKASAGAARESLTGTSGKLREKEAPLIAGDGEAFSLDEPEELPIEEVELVDLPSGGKAARAAAAADGPKRVKYNIRTPDGLVLGPIRLQTLKDLIEAGKISLSDEVSPEGGTWRPIRKFPELVKFFRMA